MELTATQIERIEHYLNRKHVKHVDIRIEVLDHIILDIEALIEKENKDFETVFYTVTSQWNTQFAETSSSLFGIGFIAPRILIHKAKGIYSTYFFMLIASYFLPLIFFSYMDYSFSELAQFYVNKLLHIAAIFFASFFLFLLIKKERSKLKTTYSFLLKTQSMAIFIGLFCVFTANFFDKNGAFNPISIGLLIAFVYTTLVYFYFYIKHKQAVNTYKIL